MDFSHVCPIEKAPARGMDCGVWIKKQRTEDTGMIGRGRVARVRRSPRFLRHHRRAHSQAAPLSANFRHQSAMQFPQTRRIGQQITVLTESRGILPVNGQLLIVEGTGYAIRPRIEDRYRSEGLGRYTDIDPRNSVFLIPAKQMNTSESSM